LVLVLLFILGFFLGIVLSRSPVTIQEIPDGQATTLPSNETEMPADNTSAEAVFIDVRNVPEENPIVPETVLPPIEEPPVPEIVQVVPPLETSSLQEVISDVPPLVDTPVVKPQEVPESPKLLETTETPAKSRVKLSSYFYFYTGIPVQTPPTNVVFVSPQWFVVTPVFVQRVVPVQVQMYQYYYYSTGFVSTSTYYWTYL